MTEVLMGYLFHQTNSRTWLKGDKDTVSQKQMKQQNELDLICLSLILVFFRMNFVSTSCNVHLAKMEFLENKHHMQAFLTLAESKVKSWIIKYGQQESVELILQNYIVSTHFDLSLYFWKNLWINGQNTLIGSISNCLTLFIHHCYCCIVSSSVIC